MTRKRNLRKKCNKEEDRKAFKKKWKPKSDSLMPMIK